MVKIFIDPGHGGKDPGAVGLGLREKDLTLSISLKIRDILNREYNDVEIRLSRTTDAYLTLGERARLANAWNADLLLSIHINASASGYGYEDFIFTGKVSAKSIEVQNAINTEVVKATDWRNRGKKRKNLQVLRDSKMPAILTESGFIDNPTDTALLKNDAFLNKIARGHVNGIAQAFNLRKKEEDKVPKVDISKLPASESHAASWEWATKQGLVNGERPREGVTREQMASVLHSVYKDLGKLDK